MELRQVGPGSGLHLSRIGLDVIVAGLAEHHVRDVGVA
jgi:hypothetical protein